MLFARRLAAASLAVVLAVFPLALERCWTACATPAVETEAAAPAAHTCHEAAGENDGLRMDPIARACGHSDDARLNQSAGVAPVKTRTLLLVSLVEPVPHLDTAIDSARSSWSSVRSNPSLSLVPLNSPLRL